MKKKTLRILAILSVVFLLTLVGCASTGGCFSCFGGCLGVFLENTGCAVEITMFPATCINRALCGCDCNGLARVCYCNADETQYTCNQQDIDNIDSTLLLELEVMKDQSYDLVEISSFIKVADMELQDKIYINIDDSSRDYLGCGFETWKKSYTFTLVNNSDLDLKDVYMTIGPKSDEKLCYIGNVDAHDRGSTTVYEYSESNIFGHSATSYYPESGARTKLYFYGSVSSTGSAGCGG